MQWLFLGRQRVRSPSKCAVWSGEWRAGWGRRTGSPLPQNLLVGGTWYQQPPEFSVPLVGARSMPYFASINMKHTPHGFLRKRKLPESKKLWQTHGATNSCHLLDTHCVLYPVPSDLQKQPLSEVLLIVPFHRCGNWGRERLMLA